MRRLIGIVGLVTLAFITSPRLAEASKITIDIRPNYENYKYDEGYGYLNSYPYPLSFSSIDGAPAVITSERDWHPRAFVAPFPGRKFKSLDADLKYDVHVWDVAPNPDYPGGTIRRTLASGTLVGKAAGEIIAIALMNPTASGSGVATMSDLVVDHPSLIPDWLPNLRINLEIKPSDEKQGYFTTVLTVDAPPVPEPGSVAVFLAAAGAGLVMHRRHRGRVEAPRSR